MISREGAIISFRNLRKKSKLLRRLKKNISKRLTNHKQAKPTKIIRKGLLMPNQLSPTKESKLPSQLSRNETTESETYHL